MESAGSNSPPRYSRTQNVAGRIIRALHHRLRLLHRSGADFFILGATGNVYTVTLSAAPSCTCPDRTVPCKHILFVYMRVLGVPFGDACLVRRTLRTCQLAHLLAAPTAADSLAGSRARERFHQLFSRPGAADHRAAATRPRGKGESVVCPICLEEMDEDGGGGGEGGELVTCGTCGNSLHGECLAKWRRSRGRRAANCVVCRARWRERKEQERYVNLGAYVSEEDVGGDGDLCAG